MKRLIKWSIRILVVVVVLIVILLLSLDSIVKAMVERRIRDETGMEAKIGRFSMGLISPVVTIEDLKIYNTPEFGGTPFIHIPELHMEYDRDAVRDRKLHLTLMRIKFKELDVVRNEKGQTNIMSLLTTATPAISHGTKTLKKEGVEFGGIDVLNISLGKVRYMDLKDPTQNREWNFAVENQVVKNIKEPEDIYTVLFLVVLRSGVSLDGLPLGKSNLHF